MQCDVQCDKLNRDLNAKKNVEVEGAGNSEDRNGDCRDRRRKDVIESRPMSFHMNFQSFAVLGPAWRAEHNPVGRPRLTLGG